MDGSLQLPPLVRMLALNTEINEIRTVMMREPVVSGCVADLQESLDQRRRAILTTCWLSNGYELEEYESEEDGSDGDPGWDFSGAG